tara:strand:- start:4360 stop:4479 length:120 start_codon:yes stop_codon:yes gene_type:complete
MMREEKRVKRRERCCPLHFYNITALAAFHKGVCATLPTG